ncbi:DNA-directed RNA polymerase subunit beta [Pelodictyon luteolum]|uniref:DNA-directed RNA polymerase subunit beta n=1 Tax=Chlorobium luteolum (strain DSM 273 / BCRC 81028 / 2530) TaxID=319225 RepID=RPOB_CHLL3|nr:DNA-directed RNA polymerase subunit beta [Pelodictyon luteolum]Q3B1H7.1 RecName: Full=DNA-directed RNA polymerase subunit beta; Short=RNAP subunit beta; AltName: Full=RNA polymerase subunit beta; AltName: Full=Transcriptase subunit beta [Pelodictyon luteolum DSM 273]ABB24804.1 DNA-directed RNA polymerase subunit beta [Pelodictyon luteolum DSM 273]
MADATSTPSIDFSKIQSVIEAPDLLKVQLDSFHNFIQDSVPLAKRREQGLEKVLRSAFPITDTRGLYLLEYISYSFDKPKYTVEDCIERGLTYDVSLKVKLKLSYKDEADETDWKETIQQEVYLGRIPYMTERGTFIVNGAERVVVAQLHRSPGVVFSEAVHPNGKKMYSAKIVPTRGSWIEFQTDINNQIFVYIDQKKNFLVTALLRAIGFTRDEDILGLFDLVEEVPMKAAKRERLVGQYLASDIVDMQTGEVVSARTAITEEVFEQIQAAGYKSVKIMKSFNGSDKGQDKSIVINTILNDSSATEEEALEIVYEELRANEAPDIDAARSFLERTFFNQKKYDLGEVGRYRIGKKLSREFSEMDEYLGGKGELKQLSDTIHQKILQTIQSFSDEPIGEEVLVLTHLDIIAVINYLIKLVNGQAEVDDVDHLANRRVRSVGEQLAAQFVIGLARMGKNVREKLNSRDSDKIAPADLINARTVSSVVSSFFATSQLSQFMDQTNPLAEMTNKRRVSALGPGGLTRERAGFEVRDVHYTHYGRLCPIETPEGPNIGLISSLSVYAEINDKGFIQTPYRVVEKGHVTDTVVMLSAEDEENKITVPVSIPIDANNNIAVESVQARTKGDYPLVPSEDVNYMDVSPVQIVSAAAALIPFLEHDDGNRALMGANMQRQAVPLLVSEAPVVGTGMEAKVARDSRSVILGEGPGFVEEVTSEFIKVRYDIDTENNEHMSLLDPDEGLKTYRMIKFKRSNQDTCISQRPIVKNGQKVDKGTVLADSSSTEDGELALGKNVLVAFMPWRGYNFEDAIILSERLVYDDVFTSIHVHEFEANVRDTKRGEEQFTRDIYNVSDEALRNLDENGIVRIGAEVKERDILVGKITPKGESDPTPEEKLLRAIFGDKSSDVKDASMHVPAGMKGIVIKTKLFSRKKKVGMDVKEKLELIDARFERREIELRKSFEKWLRQMLQGKKVKGLTSDKGKVLADEGAAFDDALLAKFSSQPFLESIDFTLGVTGTKKVDEAVIRLVKEFRFKLKDLADERDNEKYKVNVGDELPPGIEELAKVYIAQKRKIQVGDKMAGRHGNKGVVGKILPIEDMPFMADGTPVDIVLNPLGVPSRMNIGQLYETSLGWAAKKLGVKFKTPIFNGATYEEVQAELERAGLPMHGKVRLYDGRTGEQFDDEVTVGYIYMLKLSHLVDDKIHARSTGPYSLITQQPLGGKAQFGGQRFGEMEVWALEAYGAANILREMLTVKSDDVVGRNKTYEAIVKGQNLPEPGIPESFNVLIRELQGLGLEIRIDDRVP